MSLHSIKMLNFDSVFGNANCQDKNTDPFGYGSTMDLFVVRGHLAWYCSVSFLLRMVNLLSTHIISSMLGRGLVFSSGICVKVASVSRRTLATDTAFSRATRITLVGSIIPASIKST